MFGRAHGTRGPRGQSRAHTACGSVCNPAAWLGNRRAAGHDGWSRQRPPHWLHPIRGRYPRRMRMPKAMRGVTTMSRAAGCVLLLVWLWGISPVMAAGSDAPAPPEIAPSATNIAPNPSGSDPSIGARGRVADADPLGLPSGEPLPRFTVGWYCPAPNREPWREAVAFGLGVVMIWAMSERRKARQARADAQA